MLKLTWTSKMQLQEANAVFQSLSCSNFFIFWLLGYLRKWNLKSHSISCCEVINLSLRKRSFFFFGFIAWIPIWNCRIDISAVTDDEEVKIIDFGMLQNNLKDISWKYNFLTIWHLTSYWSKSWWIIECFLFFKDKD